MEGQQSFNLYYVRIKKVWERPMVKTFSEASATLFLIAFFLLAALKPTIETIFTLTKKIADAQETEMAMSKKIQDLSQAFALYTSLEKDIPAIDTYLPASPNTSGLAHILEQNMSDTSLINSAFTFSPYFLSGSSSDSKSDMGNLTISLDSQGTYDSTLVFLKNLSEAQRIFQIEGVELNKTNQLINFSFSAKTYYYLKQNEKVTR